MHIPIIGKLATPVAPSNGSVPARKVGKGSTYESTGMVPSPQMGMEAGSALPVVIQEIVPELASAFQRQLTYTKMMNDAGVDVSVRAVKTPVLGAEFFMEPYGEDPQDALIAEFCWDNLAGGMNQPFLSSLEDILHFYEDAYSVLEKCWEIREWSPNSKGANSKQYTMLKKLGVRPVSTIGEIVYDDNGGPVSLKQNAIRGDKTVEEVVLDIGNLLIFTFNKKGGDITGKSILRTAYPHWYYKTHFYKIDAIQKERHSLGVPKGMLKPGFKPADRNILRNLLKNLRSNEESFMLLTPNVDVEFAEIKGNLVDVLLSAEHHNTMLLLNVMAQFLSLGTNAAGSSGGGGRATAGSGVDMFMKSLKYVANYVAEIINMHLIPEMVVYNFPTTNFPKLRVRNIGETRDLQMFASALSSVLSQEGITMDDPTEAWFRRVFDMPSRDPSTARVKAGPGATTDTTPSNGGKSNGGAAGRGGVKPATSPGNKGKPPGAAAEAVATAIEDIDTGDAITIRDGIAELAIHMPDMPTAPASHTHNQFEHEHHEHVNVETPAPIVNIHMPSMPEPQQVQLKESIVTDLGDGRTRVEYNYGEDE